MPAKVKRTSVRAATRGTRTRSTTTKTSAQEEAAQAILARQNKWSVERRQQRRSSDSDSDSDEEVLTSARRTPKTPKTPVRSPLETLSPREVKVVRDELDYLEKLLRQSVDDDDVASVLRLAADVWEESHRVKEFVADHCSKGNDCDSRYCKMGRAGLFSRKEVCFPRVLDDLMGGTYIKRVKMLTAELSDAVDTFRALY